MRILFYSTDYQLPRRPEGCFSIGPPGYYRLGIVAQALRDFGGHQTMMVPILVSDKKTGEFVGKTWEGCHARGAAIVVLQRATALTAEQIENARRFGQAVVWDVDDLLFNVPNKALRRFATAPGIMEVDPREPAPSATNTRRYSEDNLRSLLAAVDLVTTSTPFLARTLTPVARRVKVIRNAIDAAAWTPEDVSDGPVLGWTAMLKWRAGDHDQLTRWLGHFLEKHDLKFVHVGHNGDRTLAELCRVDPERVELRRSRQFLDFLESRPLSGIDIQLIPLSNHPWNEAKSYLKGLESAASGVPFVASASAEYQKLGFGRLVGTELASQKPRHWEAAIEPLLDRSERERVSRELRAGVACHDIQVRWPEWEHVYSELLEQPVA